VTTIYIMTICHCLLHTSSELVLKGVVQTSDSKDFIKFLHYICVMILLPFYHLA
jgi:hypothetical protein